MNRLRVFLSALLFGLLALSAACGPGLKGAIPSGPPATPTARGDANRESDVDLAQYLEFNRSPLGTRYNDAMMAAFIEALTRGSVTMGPLIEQGMGRKKT